MAFACIRCRSEIDPNFKACPFCGEAITDFYRLHHDTPIDGKYRIIERLGVGGMGEVFKVVHVHLGSTRVVKLMRPNFATDRDAHERFLREARLATKIHHPNVATLFDFSSLPDGSFYMVWEYIEGTNLHELIQQRGPLSPRHASALAVQALHGLDAVHRAGIVHRDISPENIMVTRDDDGERIKIIDLGIAKQWSDEEGEKTKTGMFVGKWKYCSPEHLGILNPGERIDARADLYSFGIVFYEMLTGVTPFQATTPHGFLVAHGSERPAALRDMNATVTASPELEAIIFQALEKDRNRRFATARDFARALEPAIPSLDDTCARAKKRQPAATVRSTDIGSNSTRRTVEMDARPTLSTTPNEEMPAAATVPSAQLDAKTVSLAAREIEHPTITVESPMKRRTHLQWGIAAAVVLVIAVGAARMFFRSATPTPAAVVVASTVPKPALNPAGSLGVNAFPWGEIKSIRDLKSGAVVPLAQPLITPAPIELAAGRYEITLSNPAFADPIRQIVELKAGDHQTVTVQFVDPSKAALPRFKDGRR